MNVLRLGGHPVHPMLVHFPVALWSLGVAADGGGLIAGDDWWWKVGFGCQALGLLSGLVAMMAGFFDYVALSQNHVAHNTAGAHMLVMCASWLLFLTSVGLRGWPAGSAPPLAAIVAAGFGCITMVVGGWLGGRLVYRFAVGVEERRAP